MLIRTVLKQRLVSHESLDIGHKSFNISYKNLDIGHINFNISYENLDIGYTSLDVVTKVSMFNCDRTLN